MSAATQTHGPPHVLILGVLVLVVIGGLVYKAVTGRRRVEDGAGHDRDSER